MDLDRAAASSTEDGFAAIVAAAASAIAVGLEAESRGCRRRRRLDRAAGSPPSALSSFQAHGRAVTSRAGWPPPTSVFDGGRPRFVGGRVVRRVGLLGDRRRRRRVPAAAPVTAAVRKPKFGRSAAAPASRVWTENALSTPWGPWGRGAPRRAAGARFRHVAAPRPSRRLRHLALRLLARRGASRPADQPPRRLPSETHARRRRCERRGTRWRCAGIARDLVHRRQVRPERPSPPATSRQPVPPSPGASASSSASSSSASSSSSSS